MQCLRKSLSCQSWCASEQDADGIVLLFRNSSFTAWLAGKGLWIQLSKPAALGTYKGKRFALGFEPFKGPVGWLIGILLNLEGGLMLNPGQADSLED